jgi:hypothetical protein
MRVRPVPACQGMFCRTPPANLSGKAQGFECLQCTQSGNHPLEGLAKYCAYKPDMNYKSLIIILPIIFWLHTFKPNIENFEFLLLFFFSCQFSQLETLQNHFVFKILAKLSLWQKFTNNLKKGYSLLLAKGNLFAG